jgi:hypothetical protein
VGCGIEEIMGGGIIVSGKEEGVEVEAVAEAEAVAGWEVGVGA